MPRRFSAVPMGDDEPDPSSLEIVSQPRAVGVGFCPLGFGVGVLSLKVEGGLGLGS